MSSKTSLSLTKEIVKNLLESSLSSKFEASSLLSRGKEKSHKQKINSITDWYRSHRLVMVLGAGSSVSYGLPDWNTLLQKLLLVSIKSDNDNSGDNIEKAGVLARTFTSIFEPNSLIAARYLNNYFKKGKAGF